MQDVIFSGTENRKPLSYASVAITLDNADHKLPVDYEEVTVTRKLYRSGESEYLINGASCRLKDINEMFYDTGIGKEGYSIIGQGQIDKILSGKPDVKFKRRKNLSVKKLEEERMSLTLPFSLNTLSLFPTVFPKVPTAFPVPVKYRLRGLSSYVLLQVSLPIGFFSA